METKNTDANASEATTESTTLAQPVIDTPSEAEAPQNESTVQPQASQPSSTPWGVIITLFLLLIVAFASMAGGYYLYQQLQAQQAEAAKLNQKLQAALVEPNQRIASLEQQQGQFAASVESAMAQSLEQQTQLEERVSIIAQRNPNHWRAEEAKYLVRLAGQKLWLEKDPSTATSLLKAADERIKSMRDPSLMPLRKALSKDIAAVASVKNTDISGTVLTLDAIIDNLDKLPLNRAETHFSAEELADNQVSESLNDWQSNLAKSWQALIDDFVIIRKRTTDAAPLLEPDQQWYLVENTKNKLLQAQLALYRQDQVNYRNSIKLARKWIFEYFDLKDQQTIDTLATLDALETLKIQSVSIERFAASNMLNQLVTYGNLMTEETQ
ncbi:uroporphyrinogen-III C-methyltransferase [Shewanella fidelis]|uniref:Uroporphyrinogen-III C-methyltransferase n=1 Tax=Shewanella fidelis TaxID=173509 RepID=A0AAW8NHC0_9GAMM|nr:uroporphyrinogen-III C-methyltransferase [Shewanella fidelis]MDR8522087.1 uroporphyrinogen-III C-methyltransferase [Shewanella fidelis]MDW4814101.1 uroporphyrinogen-III C-methyltransferase [Shewanella fidelis]MDW4818300.1 uroporphyrinogen-III C-methyltransferase [Shewanella fidelis]MDW4822390.1 uroporphyrinogen-III C-methyltransferase [Shewanella fidelis]MDW4826556.1 uroporphyrinogen-III C-methyltransferase [Shewanella fidelis]